MGLSRGCDLRKRTDRQTIAKCLPLPPTTLIHEIRPLKYCFLPLFAQVLTYLIEESSFSMFTESASEHSLLWISAAR